MRNVLRVIVYWTTFVLLYLVIMGALFLFSSHHTFKGFITHGDYFMYYSIFFGWWVCLKTNSIIFDKN